MHLEHKNRILAEEEEEEANLTKIEQNPLVILRMDKTKITRSMWVAAVSKIPSLLQMVPENYFDQSESDNAFFLELLPKVIEEAVAENCLYLIPSSQKSEELCLKIIEKDFTQIQYVPIPLLENPSFRTHPIIAEAIDSFRETIKKDWSTIETCPAILLDEETALGAAEAADQNWGVLKYIPEAIFKTLENHPSGVIDKLLQAFIHEMEACEQEPVLIGYHLKTLPVHFLTDAVCLELMRINPSILDSLPQAVCNFDFIKRCQKTNHFFNSFLLEYLGDYQKSTSLNHAEYQELCIDQLEKSLENFKRIPREICDFNFCLKLASNKAIKGSFLSFIEDYKRVTTLNEEAYLLIIKTTLHRDGEAIQYLPSHLKSYQLWESAISQNLRVLQLLINFIENGNPTNISETQLIQLFQKAIKLNPDAFLYLPKNLRSYPNLKSMVEQECQIIQAIYKFKEQTSLTDEELKELSLIAFEVNRTNLQYLPIEEQTAENFERTVSVNGMLLKICINSPSWVNLPAEQQSELMTIAVKKSPMALQYVPDSERAALINRIGAKRLLTQDFACFKFFPKEQHFQDEADAVLARVEYIIFSTSYYEDREIIDTVAVYSEHPKRINKVVHCSEYIEQKSLLNAIKRQNSSPSLNLVLLGHSHANSNDMAGRSVTEITKILLELPTINRLSLLGCKTAVAKPLEAEASLFPPSDNFLAEFKKPCGMLVMNAAPDPKRYKKLLHSICQDSQGQTAAEALILVKGESKAEPQNQLIYIQKKEDNSFEEYKLGLNSTQLAKLGAHIGNKKKEFSYPRSKKIGQDVSIHRGGKRASFLSVQELNDINTVLSVNGQVETYETEKSKYPSLRQAKLSEFEEDRLLPSFQKKMIEAIKKEPELTRSIEVKGYLHCMHVDLKQKKLIGSEFAYSGTYVKFKNPSCFFNGDNINRKKMGEFYESQTKSNQAPEEEKRSNFKAISFSTPKK